MKRICLFAALLTAGPAVHAAGIYGEPFADAGAAGEASLSLGAGAWSIGGGEARIDFAGTAPYAIPDLATLVPSASAFKGDYTAAGIELIGFRFHASDRKPTAVYLELTSGDTVFQKKFPVPDPGTWTTLSASLAGFAEGGWTVKKGGPEDFASALRSVDSIAIRIRRAGADVFTCRIRDLFVDGLPEAAGSARLESGGIRMTWDGLQPGARYAYQRSQAVDGPWLDAGLTAVTGSLHVFSVPMDDGDAPAAFFRLRQP